MIVKVKSRRVLSVGLQIVGIAVVPITFLNTPYWYGYPVPYIEIGGILIGFGVLLSPPRLKLKNLLDQYFSASITLQRRDSAALEIPMLLSFQAIARPSSCFQSQGSSLTLDFEPKF